MPFICHEGVQIHYQVKGQGPPLVLLHGFTSNLQLWKLLGYVDALSNHYRLILIDCRGHGQSSKPHTAAAYDLHLRVGDVLAVLDHLSIAQAHIYGYSMGGWIGFGLAAHAPQRVHSLVAVGAHCLDDLTWVAFNGIDGQDEEAFFTALETVLQEPLSPSARIWIQQGNDLQALSAAAQVRSSLEDLLTELSIPMLLVVGDADPRYPLVQVCAQKLSHASLQILPNCNHTQCFLESHRSLLLVQEFLAGQTLPPPTGLPAWIWQVFKQTRSLGTSGHPVNEGL
jgi:pimeloyl-ACP methyl ester carboxylesterase